MSEDMNEKTSGSGVEAPGPRGRAEAPDDRIAPSAPRGEEKASGGEAPSAPVPARRRSSRALPALGVAVAAIALCAVAASAGFAAGWLGDPAPSEPVPMPSVVTDAPSGGKDVSQGDETDPKDAVEEASEGADGETDAAADGENAADADGSAASAPGGAPSGTEPSASESVAAPAPAPAPEPAPEPAPPAPSTVTVSVYIDSSRAVSNGYPSSLGGGTVTLNQGASVYDALCATGVSVGGSSGYVSSIGGLAEFSCGPGSGWLYFVNGSSPGYGCGSYILSGGESITWVYTLDMGNDL